MTVLGLTVQNARLLDHAREVSDRLFVDDRRLRVSLLPDLWQVAAGQNGDEMGVHRPIKARSESVRNHPMGWAQYRSGPLLIVDVDSLALSQTTKKRVRWFMLAFGKDAAGPRDRWAPEAAGHRRMPIWSLHPIFAVQK